MPVELSSEILIGIRRSLFEEKPRLTIRKVKPNERTFGLDLERINKPFTDMLKKLFRHLNIEVKYAEEFELREPEYQKANNLLYVSNYDYYRHEKEDYYHLIRYRSYYDSSDGEGECPEEIEDKFFLYFDRKYGYVDYRKSPIELLGKDLIMIHCALDGG